MPPSARDEYKGARRVSRRSVFGQGTEQRQRKAGK